MGTEKIWGGVVSSVFVLAGCRATPVPEPGAFGAQAVVDHEIDSARDRIHLSQARLVMADSSSWWLSQSATGDHPTYGSLSVAWDGDAVPLLKGLAAAHRIGFVATGPRLPLPVSLHVDNLPFESVLQELRYQTADRAAIDATATGLALRYIHSQQ